jgi:hypothetical protein
VSSHIDSEITDLNNRCLPAPKRNTTQISTYSGLQFLDPERLGHAVMRASIERLDFSLLLSPNGKNNDWKLCARPQLPAQFQPIHIGHHEIGDHQVRCPISSDLGSALSPSFATRVS